MKKTIIVIGAAAVLASSSAWAEADWSLYDGTDAAAQDGFPIADQDPDSYCLCRGAVGTPLNSSCIDWIQRYYDIARIYWREASPAVRVKCVGQAAGSHGTDPMQLYVTLEACLETWTREEDSKRRHTFNAGQERDPPCDGQGSRAPRDNRDQCEDDQ